MSITQTHKSRRAQADSRHPAQSSGGQNAIPGAQVPGAASPSCAAGASAHGVLSLELCPKSAFILPEDKYHAPNLDDVILEMHAALQQIPKYKDVRKWESLPTKIELAEHLVTEIKRHVPSGNEWLITEVDSQIALEYGKYANDISDRYNPLPMEWLPALQAQSEELYILVAALLYKIARGFGFGIIITRFDEFHIDNPGEMDFGDEGENYLWMADLGKYLKGGIAYHTLRSMERMSNNHSPKVLAEQIAAFKPKGNTHKKIHAWILSGIPLLKESTDLEFYMMPHEPFEDGEPITLRDTFNFPWSLYDGVARVADEYRDATYNEIGIMEAGVKGGYYNKKHVKPASLSPLKLLAKFIETGRAIYFDHYDNNIEKLYAERRNN